MRTQLTCAGFVGVLASGLLAGTVSITSSSITGPTGTPGTDSFLYRFDAPTTLTQITDGSVPLTTILQGSAPTLGDQAAPKGNVELFANSENGTYDDPSSVGAFRTVTRTSFSGSLQSVPITVSSVNGNDWFTTTSSTFDNSYAGAANNDTLARKWFNDFLTTYTFDTILTNAGVSAPTIAMERLALYNVVLTQQHGFARLSDPNVSYVNQDDVSNIVSLGLAGTSGYLKNNLLAYIAIDPLLTTGQKASVAAQLSSLTIDASEMVKVDYNGNSQYLYGFIAGSTSLTTTDPTESYNQNFEVSFQGIPEPATLGVLSLALGALLRRRTRV